MQRIIIGAFCTAILYGCAEDRQSRELSKLNWVMGSWKTTAGEGSFVETWKQLHDTMLTGTGYFIAAEKDTSFSEKLAIESRHDGVYYIAHTAGNKGKAIEFKAIPSEGKEVIFGNDAHDFPQRIIYTPVNGDSMTVKITGKQNGKERTETFTMKRQ